MKRLAAILLFLFAACLAAQNPSLIFVPSAPTGACTGGPPVEVVISTGTMYTCQGGTWTAVGGGSPSGFPITLGSTSITAGSTTTAITGLTIDGVSPTTMGFVDPTSSIQTQLNGKAASNATMTVNSTSCALGSSCAPPPPAQYKTWSCQPGLGDGLNAMTAGTYLESTCWNKTGVTVTLTGVACFTDNNGSSTLNAAGNTLGALLTGAVTCTTGLASGTQSANVAFTNGDFIKFTYVSDGTSKQSTWVVTGTY